ncbi:Uncharacterized protein FWK35_00026977 [Aphis craccivora]|uniref:Uncharacterized protein n=1 Tax=Aphis craccivora TaxID=307492 RepID=A0A6G0YYD2_APHCR|nr:Uncharacterized protein FWK35_00026977 [Aphis craccivora]
MLRTSKLDQLSTLESEKCHLKFRKHLSNWVGVIIDSERSDECIDFTMMCVFFFVSVYSITSRNNTPISNFGGGFQCKSEYPWCIIKVKS